jgi:putative FmdB family regulatory protein
MPIYDYECECGEKKLNELAKYDEKVYCDECGAEMARVMNSVHMFSTIVPTYPGSGAHKAGHIHKHGNRPATKTQVGYGGSVSSDHPTGSKKNVE